MELALGERIRIARTRCKKSQVELARAVGISKTTLSDIETGNTVAPSSAIITDIARVLNVSADFLLGLRDEPDSGGRSQPITGSASMTQEAQTIKGVSTEEAFFGVAESLLPGVQLLVNTPPSPAMPITFLAGHILECLLKAFLSKAGISEEDLCKQFGHDLS